MNKRVNKVISIVFVLMLILATPCISFATDAIRDVNPALPGGSEQFTTTTQKVIGAMMWIGYACAIGMIVFIGIKYILASADEKASLKGMLVKVVIGSLIIVMSLQITNIVISVFSSNSKGGSSGTSDNQSSTYQDYSDVNP